MTTRKTLREIEEMGNFKGKIIKEFRLFFDFIEIEFEDGSKFNIKSTKHRFEEINYIDKLNDLCCDRSEGRTPWNQEEYSGEELRDD